MADIARALISKVIDVDDLTTPMAAGIRSTWFEDQTHRSVWRWMLEYQGRYAETPTVDALLAEFPNYRLLRPKEPLEYYIDQFREQRRRAIMVDGIADAAKYMEVSDTKNAEQAFSKALLRLGREVSSLTDENAVETRKERYATYREMKRNAGKLRGIPTGFQTLDWATGGFRQQQFVLYGGAQKQGKSFMMMKAAIAAQEAGKRVLFLSFEMSAFEQLCRYDGIWCKVNATRLLHGALEDEHWKKLKQGYRLMANMPSFHISSDISATTTVSALAGKIQQHQPDIVFVDGVYLMENEAGAEPLSAAAYTAISRSLKRLAQRTGLPVIGSTQALSGKMDRNGVVTLHSLGWSSAWAQDADLIIGVERVQDEPLIKVRVVGGRNVAPCEIGVTCNWEESLFEENEEIRGDTDE